MRDVAIIIDNLVQFFSVRDGLDDLMNNGYSVDIYVSKDERRPEEFTETCKKIKQFGYKVNTQYKGQSYRVLMEPYPKIELKPELMLMKYKYRIKYKYSLITAKPKPVYSPKWNLRYDAILTHSLFEADALSPFADTYRIFPTKYRNSREATISSRKGKKNLLYMPTFNDDEDIDIVALEDAFKELEKKYTIAIKVHQGIQHRENEKDFFAFLEGLKYKKYYQDTPLGEIMKTVDVVLAGNSGSIYEAMYMGKPVAIFAKDLTKYFYIVNPYHVTLIQNGVLQATDKESEISNVVDEAIKNFKTQEKIAKEQFVFSEDREDETFLGVIKSYIEKADKDDDKYLVKKAIIDGYFGKKDRQVELINMYEGSLSWKITKPLRVVKYHIGKLLKGRK